MKEEKAREVIAMIKAETIAQIAAGVPRKTIQQNLTMEMEEMGLTLLDALHHAEKMYLSAKKMMNKMGQVVHD